MHELKNPEHPDVRIATAQWTPPERVGELLPFGDDHVFLGRDATGKPVGFGGKGHVLLVGAPRSGKGSCIEIPTIVLRNRRAPLWSFSTRGDTTSVAATARGPGIPGVCDGAGQRVAVADPCGICDVPDSLRIRPNILMGMLDPKDPECVAAAARLATAILPLPNGGEQYFVKDGRPCIQAASLHVRTAPIFDGRRSLMTAAEILLNGDIETWRVLRRRGEIEHETPQDVLWESMRQNKFFNGKLVREGNYYSSLVDVAGKQWKGVAGEIHAAMAFLDDDGMRQTLCGDDDFRMSWLKTDPNGTSFFCALRDDRMETDFAFPRLLYEWFAWDMKRIPGPSASGKRVLAQIGEFGALKRMDSVQHGMAQLAGNSVQIIITLQSLGQLREIYGEHGAAVFKAGCPCQIFLDLGHDDYTAEYIQKSSGDVEIITRDRSHSITRGTNQSRTVGESVQVNYGISDGENESHGTQSGSSGQVGGSAGTHWSTSTGHSFGGSLFNVIRPLCFRPEWKTNTGVSSGQNGQRSWGSGWNDGTSEQRGHSRQTNLGVSVGVSKSMTEGTSYSETEGWSEHRHKRPLIAINDALNEFVRIADRSDPRYPGLALVRLAGHGPMVVRRDDYFNNPLCYRKYGRDYEYPFSQAPKPSELIATEDALRRTIASEADARRMSRALANVRVPVFLPFDRVRSMLLPGEKLTFPYSKRHGRRAHLRGVVLDAGEPLFGSQRLLAVLKNPLACVPDRLLWNVFNPSGGEEKGIYCSLRPANQVELEQLVKQRMRKTGQRLDEAIKSTIADLVKETETPLVEYAQAKAEVELMERRMETVQWIEPVRYAGPLLTAGGAGIALATGLPLLALGLGIGCAFLIGGAVNYEYEERQHDIAAKAFEKQFRNGEADL